MTKSQPVRRPGRPLKSAEDASLVIRRAAVDIFSRQGFQGTSIADIAKAAKVAKPLIHYHFASKEELWRAVVTDAFSALHVELQSFQKTLTEAPALQATIAIAHQLVGFAARHPHLVRIVVDETTKGGERSEWLINHFLVPLYEIARALITAFEKKTLPDTERFGAEHVIPVILGAMNFAFLDAEIISRVFGVDVYDPAYLDRHGAFLGRLFNAAFGQPNP